MHTLDAFAQDKLDELQRRGLRRALAETVREDGIWVERGGGACCRFPATTISISASIRRSNGPPRRQSTATARAPAPRGW